MLIPSRHRAQHVRYRTEYSKTHTARSIDIGRDLFAVRKDGSEFPVEIGLQPLEMPSSKDKHRSDTSASSDGSEFSVRSSRDSQVHMVLAAVTDITVRKQAESLARDVAQSVIRSRGEILTHMSHELRTPLVRCLIRMLACHPSHAQFLPMLCRTECWGVHNSSLTRQ
jgi:signal transduction histidine kinase